MVKGLGIIDEEALNIFTDGSSFPLLKRAAGVGIHLVWVNEQGHEEIEDYAPPGWEEATIDEMEIMAITVGLIEAKRFFDDLHRFKYVLVFSDSNYVVENFNKAMNVWPNRKWLGSNQMPVANIELWKNLRKAVKKYPLQVKIEWVRAHKSNKHNRAADKLARKSAQLPVNPRLRIRETARKWSSRKTISGCVPINGQVAKIRIIGREYITKAKTGKYCYEIIDPNDPNFMDVDFVYCQTNLSRHKCYEVQFNDDHSKPTIVEITAELNSDDYKYS